MKGRRYKDKGKDLLIAKGFRIFDFHQRSTESCSPILFSLYSFCETFPRLPSPRPPLASSSPSLPSPRSIPSTPCKSDFSANLGVAIPTIYAALPSSSIALPPSSTALPPSSTALPPSSIALLASSTALQSSSTVFLLTSTSLQPSSTAFQSSPTALPFHHIK